MKSLMIFAGFVFALGLSAGCASKTAKECCKDGANQECCKDGKHDCKDGNCTLKDEKKVEAAATTTTTTTLAPAEAKPAKTGKKKAKK